MNAALLEKLYRITADYNVGAAEDYGNVKDALFTTLIEGEVGYKNMSEAKFKELFFLTWLNKPQKEDEENLIKMAPEFHISDEELAEAIAWAGGK